MTMTKDSAAFKEVSVLLRSLITPYNNDGGIRLSKLYEEYKEEEQEELPFRALGYSSITALLDAVENVHLVRKYDDWYATTTPNSKTAHIHELIANQRSSSRKKRSHSYGTNRFHNAGRVPSYRPPSDTQSRFSSAPSSSYGYNRSRSQPSNDYSSRSRSSTTTSSSSSSSLYNRSSSSRPAQSSYDRPRGNYNGSITTTPPSYGRSYSYSSVQQKTPSPPTVTKTPLSQRKVHVYLPESAKKSEPTTPPSNTSSTKSDTEFRKPDVPSLSSSRSRHSSSNENSSRTRVSSSSPSNRNKIPIILKEREQILPPLPPSPPPKSKSPLPPLPESPSPPSPPSLLTLKIKPPSSSSSVLSSSGKSSKKTLTPLQERLKNLEIYSTKTSTEPTTPKTTTAATPTATPTPTATTTTTIVGNDPRKEVESLAAKLKLPRPLYQCAAAKGPHENYSVLSLGPGYKFYSYPQGANSEAEAQAIAAKKAIMKLCEDMSTNNKILPITKDDKIIAQRIVEIVNAHRSGVIEDSIPNYYKKNYNELLPNNWTEILVSLDNMIEIDNCVAGRLITKKTEISRTSPHPLVLPTEDPPWAVEITRVESTREVWGRLSMSPYTELLVALEKDMRDHYSCVVEPATKVYSFHYYAVESCGAWHRVQIENIAIIDGKEKAYVFFIDIGDREWMDCKLLYPMLQQFYKIAAQAVKMSVSRLEDFASCEKVTDIAEEILDSKLLYIEVLDQEIDSSGVHNITSVFWDTSTEEDINLNEEIIQNIEVFCSQSPYVDKANLKVLLTSVDDDGNIFLKSMNDALDIYQIILDKVTKVELTDDLKEKVKLENLNIDRTKIFEEIFLVDYNNDNKWVRVKIIKILDLDLFKVFAIDKGYIFDVEKSKLLRLEILSKFLNSFPQQVTQVTLDGINKLNLKMIKRLKELTPKDETLSCLVIKSGKVPCVELVKRTTDNLLVSINLNLKEYQTNNNTKIDDNKIKSKYRRSSLPNKIKLRAPIVATRGKVFSAYVTNNCANPDNFIVQPRQNINTLKEMMKKLSVTCDNYDGPQLERVQAGQLCAAQHSDGLWYRAYINHILNDQTIAVYFCDYGSMSITSIDKLQPLGSLFFDLPYQAIRAKLIGIKPRNGDWDMKTCFVFRDLVVDKNFEATIEDIETDIIRNYDILGLKLTDKTSLSRSRDINQVLIDKNIAVSTI
ncbi:hypothetical protein HCN44_002171 [Aphidius gifuensis]|uniref:Tudor domain-containing protein n=1 Tax=Aphidius gifuensis TaxID=684658 RepID=A0A835CTZ8_APHGI|nr:uncharacterized protein LOC122847528 [Aphidius gifuensis]XP_044001214.1 uncharacterized protein LOC122847528 [Aphidius gifuensis]KAF7996539.1 hypothetical protein HCN44_002171 [Aphidius gifuensis]